MKAASSDLDLVLEAITYIQKLQNKLVSLSDPNLVSIDTNQADKKTKEQVNERLVWNVLKVDKGCDINTVKTIYYLWLKLKYRCMFEEWSHVSRKV